MTTGTQIRASVIIVSYNALAKLLACLESVTRSLPSDCEIVVLDNASSESNAEAVAASFPQVRLLRSDVNLGFGPGCNRAAEAAGGEFLAFLNPDTVVEPGWIDELISILNRDSRAGLVTPKIVMARTPDLINTCGCDIHLSGIATCRGLL